jgi:hypothetical protein
VSSLRKSGICLCAKHIFINSHDCSVGVVAGYSCTVGVPGQGISVSMSSMLLLFLHLPVLTVLPNLLILVQLYSPLLDLSRFLSFLFLCMVGTTLWPGDQPVSRPLPTHRTTRTQNKHTDIHASSGIRIHDPSV